MSAPMEVRQGKDTDTTEAAEKEVEVNRSPQPVDTSQNREMVGGFLYVSTETRPDVGYAIRNVARQAEMPTKTDMIVCKRILRYLQGMVDILIGIVYCGNCEYENYLDLMCDNGYIAEPSLERLHVFLYSHYG